MALTAGTPTKISSSDTLASVQTTAASGGTGPYTNQWYRSNTSGFTPGAGNIVSGATALILNDSGLIPNAPYFYKVVQTDTGNGNITVTTVQLPVNTVSPIGQQNAFAMGVALGMLDLRMNVDTISVQVDVSQATPMYAGQAVKMVDSSGGIPKVVACTANGDIVFGFINLDMKSQYFQASDKCEISLAGNVMYLYATSAIPRGSRVTLDVTAPGCVSALVASSGAAYVGWAIDKATGPGFLIRVRISTPTFQVA